MPPACNRPHPIRPTFRLPLPPRAPYHSGMSRNGRILIAMSGGVDSSVAACLLKEQGYDPVGVFMCVGVHAADDPRATTDPDDDATVRKLKQGCCSPVDAGDARRVAQRLGIPFHVLNYQSEFGRIIDYFVDEYVRARTPNPCILCNTHVKFGKLLQQADALGADFVATGHYARTFEHHGQWRLARAANRDKDQSYVLFGIQRANLARCRFPLGDMTDKQTVRRIAQDLGLSVHDKPDSQEICFVPNNDYRTLVQSRRPETSQPGEVRDADGTVVGTHEGIVNYTVGQRRGLGIARGLPIYVTHLDAETNTVTVGPREALYSAGLIADGVNWLVDELPVGEWHDAATKIRYQHAPAAGRIRRTADGTLEVAFVERQSAVTPGQAAVAYDADDCLLAGGWIRTATPLPSREG